MPIEFVATTCSWYAPVNASEPVHVRPFQSTFCGPAVELRRERRDHDPAALLDGDRDARRMRELERRRDGAARLRPQLRDRRRRLQRSERVVERELPVGGRRVPEVVGRGDGEASSALRTGGRPGCPSH